MKICQLISGLSIALSNQEKKFVDSHKDKISIYGLNEHDLWIAQNLLKKGVYSISKDRKILIKELDDNNSR